MPVLFCPDNAQDTHTRVKPTVDTLSIEKTVNSLESFRIIFQKIGDYDLPPPSIEITIVFQGTKPERLLGLEAISHWIVTFDGPAQSFNIACF